MGAPGRTAIVAFLGMAAGVALCWLWLGQRRGGPEPAPPPASAPAAAGTPTVAGPDPPRPPGKIASPPLPPQAAAFADFFPAPPDEAREFRELTEAERAGLAELIRAFWGASEESDRLELLEKMEAGFYGRELLAFASEALGHPGAGEAERVRLVEMLSGNISPEILPVLERARGDASDAVRAAAALASAQVRDPGVLPFLTGFLEDPSPGVRLSVTEAVASQPDGTRHAVFGAAVKGRHADVARAALGEMEVGMKPSLVPLMIEGMNSPNPEVREEVRFALEFHFDAEFPDAGAAHAWWLANRHRYDADMVLIE